MGSDNIISTKMVTGKVRLSYAHIWEPSSIGEGTEKKYSAVLLISKDDEKTIDKINAAIEAAKEAGSAKLKGVSAKKIKLPLRDGDEEADDKGEDYKGHFFLTASSRTQPGIVDMQREEIMDRAEVYSGCYVLASINFYAFNTNGNAGVAVGLNHIMKISDGEALAGRSSAQDDFADVDFDGIDDLF